MAAILAFVAKLWSVLQSLGLTPGQWIRTHQAQFQKAVTDLFAGQTIQQVLADLFAATGLKAPMQCPTQEECCAAVCCSAADAIKAVHAGQLDDVLDALGKALCAVGACK